MKQLIIGTAGHVDHGKTVLIKTLTGVDTDRLQEEKKRGISIDLGFAPLRLPGGRLAGIVDVPGHERFIHNMLAGAAGMDLVLLVIDATEGVMPQTREHLDILGILGVQKGIVVITKTDLVEEEWLELVSEEVKEELKGTFLETAPLAFVSAFKKTGLEELKTLIDEMTADLAVRNAAGPLRLPVDRSFVIDGFGTVLTGTLIQGAVSVGDTVLIVPPGTQARVRNIQVHDTNVEKAFAGSRVALNLSGLEKSEVLRGSVVSTPGYFTQTDLIDVWAELLPGAPRPLKNLDPVHFFLGTARRVARLLLLDRSELKPSEGAFVQCRLDKPLVAERGDYFVMRSYSPMITIGGGKVLDPHPKKHRRFRQEVTQRLDQLKQEPRAGGDAAFLGSKLEELIIAEPKTLSKETRLADLAVEEILEKLADEGQVVKIGPAYLLKKSFVQYKELLLKELSGYHQNKPLDRGMSRARLRGFLPAAFSQRHYDALLDYLTEASEVEQQDDLVYCHAFVPKPSKEEQKTLASLEKIYLDTGFQPPSAEKALEQAGAKAARREEFFNYLQQKGVLVKVSDDLYFHHQIYEKALDLLRHHFKNNDQIILATFRDLLGSTRKYAQALLEHFDAVKLTRRVEDYRVPFKLK